MRPSHLLSALAALSTLTSAWSWRHDVLGSDLIADALLIPRQNNGDQNTSAQPSATPSGKGADPTSNVPKTASPTNGKQPSATGKNQPSATDASATGKQTGKATGKQTGKDAGKTSQVSVPTGAPPGGLSIVSPAVSLGTQFYRYDQTVTFVWNYTSLVKPPTGVDVLITSAQTAYGAVQTPYTLATNLSFDATQTFKWDTGKFATEEMGQQFQVGMFTLIVYEAGGSTTETPIPGELYAYSGYSFGLYTHVPAPTGLTSEFQCATCNSLAGGKMDRLAWGVLIAVVSISSSSLLLFSAGFGVF